MCLEVEGIYSESLQKSIMKLLSLGDHMILFPFAIQRKVRRWYNAVTEIDIFIDPECFE